MAIESRYRPLLFVSRRFSHAQRQLWLTAILSVRLWNLNQKEQSEYWWWTWHLLQFQRSLDKLIDPSFETPSTIPIVTVSQDPSLNQGTKHQKLPPSHSNISLELAVTFTKSSSTRKIPFSFWSRYEAAKASSITFSCTSLAFTFSNKSTRDSSSRTLTQN